MKTATRNISYQTRAKVELSVMEMLDIVIAVANTERFARENDMPATADEAAALWTRLRYNVFRYHLDNAAANRQRDDDARRAETRAERLAAGDPDLAFGPVCPGYLPTPKGVYCPGEPFPDECPF